MSEHAVEWNIKIYIEESDGLTRARARLETRDSHLDGLGTARRSPRDTAVPEIGDELSAARALLDVAHQLFDAAAKDIEGVTSGTGR